LHEHGPSHKVVKFCKKDYPIQNQWNKGPFPAFEQKERQENEHPKCSMKNKVNTLMIALEVFGKEIEVWLELVKLRNDTFCAVKIIE